MLKIKIDILKKLLPLITLLVIQNTVFASEKDYLKVEVLSFEVLEERNIFNGNIYITPASENDSFVKIKVKLTNLSKSKISLVSDNIKIESKGIIRNPRLLYNLRPNPITSVLGFNISPGKSKERTLMFELPNAVQAEYLSINTVKVSLNNTIVSEKTYFDQDWNKLSDAKNASYYRIISVSDYGKKKWKMEDYFIENNQIQCEVNLISLYPEIKEGNAIWYDEKGNITIKGEYVENKKEGLFTHYYANGNIKEEGVYSGEDKIGEFHYYYENGHKQKIVDYRGKHKFLNQYWNEEGDSLLVNGTGIVETINAKGNKVISHYSHTICNKSYQIREKRNDIVYDVVDQEPYYQGGWIAFYKSLRKQMKYPKEARKNGVQGKIYIEFIVSEKGETIDIKTIQGIGYGCEEEAIRVINLMNMWQPGKVDNKVVRTRMVVPINFKL